jgi:molecular chaperone DnaK (HSP70)
MSEEEGPASRVAIGLSFGNTNSSIAYTSSVWSHSEFPEDPATNSPIGRQGGSDCQRGRRYVQTRDYNGKPRSNMPIDRQIPSILSYVDGEEFQGTQAKAQLVRNSKNTVAYFRDFLGQG